KLELRNGESFEALIRNEDNFSIQLVDRAGRFRLLDKSDVARLTRLDVSLMPADVGRALSPDELQNLLAFLDLQRLSEETPPTVSLIPKCIQLLIDVLAAYLFPWLRIHWRGARCARRPRKRSIGPTFWQNRRPPTG